MSAVIIFDTETTDRKDGEIIEAAWLRLRAADGHLAAVPDAIPPMLAIERTFSERFCPSKAIACGAMAVHHILPHELIGCPASASFELPADTAYIVGHAIDFDWNAARSPKHLKRICTHAMAQHTWPDADGYSQVALLYRLLGATEETRAMVRSAHGALADVHMNLALLTRILAAHPELTTWSELWAYSEEARVPIKCPLKRWDGLRLDQMDDGAINWCLNQDWLDPYFRIGLERVIESRYPRRLALAGAAENDDFEDGSDDDVPY